MVLLATREGMVSSMTCDFLADVKRLEANVSVDDAESISDDRPSAYGRQTSGGEVVPGTLGVPARSTPTTWRPYRQTHEVMELVLMVGGTLS